MSNGNKENQNNQTIFNYRSFNDRIVNQAHLNYSTHESLSQAQANSPNNTLIKPTTPKSKEQEKMKNY